MPIRRISLYAGPGAGKSTTAAALYAALSKANFHVGLVTEFIKEEMVYRGQFPMGFDQVWIFGNQIHKEEKALRYNDYIVTDCPLPLSVAYAQKYNQPGWEEMQSIISQFERIYPSLNIVLSREGIRYETGGRYQDLTGAIEMDNIIQQVVENTTRGDFHVFRTVDFHELLRFVVGTLNDNLADVKPVVDVEFANPVALGNSHDDVDRQGQIGSVA